MRILGYDISLIHGRKGFEWYSYKPVKIPAHQEGGTIVMWRELTDGSIEIGNSDATISVTWNYAPFFCKCLSKKQGIRWLYGKRAKNTIRRLECAVKNLGTTQSSDYWEPTPGNAGHILSVLLGWARLHPEAIWEGD